MEGPLLSKMTFKLQSSLLLTWLIAALRSPSMIVHRFLAPFCSPKADKGDMLKSLSVLQKNLIVSPWVKATQRWPWLMRCFEPLIKSLIEPNTPTLLHPTGFLLIFYQLLNQQNITVTLSFFQSQSHMSLKSSLTPCPPHLSKRWRAARTRRFSAHPVGTHRPHAPRRVLKLKPVTSHPDQ